ncbi:Rnase Y domain-containing protein, partial [Candidatus Uhrbacteria bacterium]|nr:Rnase Y domain-containing protein [Candidatus Uhrbacteria bacterium]
MFFYALFGLAIGAGIGFAAAKFITSSKGKKLRLMVEEAEAEAKARISEAEAKEKEVLLKAKDKAVKIIEDARLEEKRALEELKTQQAALAEREAAFGGKLLEMEDVRKDLERRSTDIGEEERRVEELKLEEAKKLEEVAGLTQEQALERITHLVEEQHQETLMSRVRKLDQMESEEIDRRAKNVLAVAIQRIASSHVAETTTTNVELPNDEMKG